MTRPAAKLSDLQLANRLIHKLDDADVFTEMASFAIDHMTGLYISQDVSEGVFEQTEDEMARQLRRVLPGALSAFRAWLDENEIGSR